MPPRFRKASCPANRAHFAKRHKGCTLPTQRHILRAEVADRRNTVMAADLGPAPDLGGQAFFRLVENGVAVRGDQIRFRCQPAKEVLQQPSPMKIAKVTIQPGQFQRRAASLRQQAFPQRAMVGAWTRLQRRTAIVPLVRIERVQQARSSPSSELPLITPPAPAFMAANVPAVGTGPLPLATLRRSPSSCRTHLPSKASASS